MVLEEDWDSVGETKPERGRQIVKLAHLSFEINIRFTINVW